MGHACPRSPAQQGVPLLAGKAVGAAVPVPTQGSCGALWRCNECIGRLHSSTSPISVCDVDDTDKTAAGKVLAMLEAVAGIADDGASGSGFTVAELAQEIGRDKSIASRQLRPLVELGLVERSEDGRHRLGWRLFTLAARAGDQRLLLLAPPVMHRLSTVTGERVHLSVLRGGEVLTILSESSRQMIQAVGWVGRSAPIHCTASGRALLFDHSDDDVRRLFDGGPPPGASGPRTPRSAKELLQRLHEARARGFALADGEFDAELVAAGAPVRDFRGRIVAALNVSAPAYRLRDRLPAVGQQVAAAASHLSRITSAPAP